MGLIYELLPIALRGKTGRLWINALLFPLREIFSETLYKMKHNAQVIYMEKFLNEYLTIEAYQPEVHQATKKVLIEDFIRPERIFLYGRGEKKPVFLEKKLIYTKARYAKKYKDFVVKIPLSCRYDENALKKEINYYKLAGKDYEIQTYNK